MSCKPTKDVEEFYFFEEKGEIIYLNFEEEKKPIIIIIPSLYNSILTSNTFNNLAKNARVAVLMFPNYNNVLRLQQTDKLEYRLTYYTNAISNIIETYGPISKIISEGDNSNLSILIGANFKNPKLTFINSWYPNIKEIIIDKVYNNPSSQTDSLLSYLHFSDRSTIDVLIGQDLNKGVDNKYGYFTLSNWKDFLTYENNDLIKNYPNTLDWIYTNNTGLVTKNEVEKLKTSLSKRANTQLFTLKEFYKNKNIFSN